MHFPFPYLTQKRFRFFWPQVVDLSLCTRQQLVGRIFFLYFGVSCFICIVWPCSGTFWLSFLSPIYFWYISSCYVIRFVCGYHFRIFSYRWVPMRFTFLSSFIYCFSFYPHFSSRLCISFRISWGVTYFITD